MSIDCHIHLFKKEHPTISAARHSPQYNALFSDVQSLAKPLGINRFVLVQTSFMGTNNHYLIEHLEKFPAKFRGVFILSPDTTREKLRELRSIGMVGIRLNLFGTNLNESLNDEHLQLIEKCSLEGLSIGIHDDASRLVGILNQIGQRANRLVIDHFGRPESLPLADEDPTYKKLIEILAKMNGYIKISAPYRSKNMDAKRCFTFLEQSLGKDKLLWASDWPWTQNETSLTYAGWTKPFGVTRISDQLSANAEKFYEFI